MATAVPSTGLVTDSFHVYSDRGPRNSTELDFSKPLQSLDTTDARPSNDSMLIDWHSSEAIIKIKMVSGYHMEEPLPAATKNTTYEDLRTQNRDDYDKKRLLPNR